MYGMAVWGLLFAILCACRGPASSWDENSANGEVLIQRTSEEGIHPWKQPTCHGAGESGRGCVFGLFIAMERNGVGPRNAPVPYAEDDVRQLAAAFIGHGLMRQEDVVILVSKAATVQAITDSVRALNARMRPEDVFLFFFDGHGSQRVLAVWEEDLERNHLGRLLASVHAEQTIIVIDACYSGGFARMAARRSGHVVNGFYSSRATERSYTLPRLHSAGYLAYAFIRRVRQPDPDGRVTSQEMTDAIRRDYVELLPPEDVQHLVVTGHNAVLWHVVPSDRNLSSPHGRFSFIV